MPNAKRSIENACMPAILPREVNVEVPGLLLDMSALQQTKPSGLGYKRAAYAVFSLDRPAVAFVGAALQHAAASKQADIRPRRTEGPEDGNQSGFLWGR